MLKEKINTKKSFLKEEESAGITLIALIITVIVLLILAGTAISIAINGGDIFSKASTARESWNTAVATEQEKVEEVWNILNTMTSGNNGGGSNPPSAGLTIPAGLEVGDTVTWTPNGKYTQWKAEYYSDDDTIDKVLYSGDTARQEETTTTTSWETAADGNHNIDMTIDSWKVLKISDDRKTVTLVPSAPTTAGVKLSGAQGYNNAVKLLNNACDALYGGTAGASDGITARSINIEDMEGLMDATALSNAKGSNYPEQRSSAYSTENSKYPKIYEEEALKNINGTYSATGIGMSEEASSTADTNGFISRSIGKVTTATSIQPSQTNYYLNNANFTAALGTTNASLILPSGSSTRNYWVASRCILTFDSYCIFRVCGVNRGGLNASHMFFSVDGMNNDTLGFFPAVFLSSGVLSGANHSYTFTPAS